MSVTVRALEQDDIAAACAVWNEVVEEGVAFPQETTLSPDEGRAFFAEQSYVGVAADATDGRIVGLYILHPNNVGRCGHICNASYAVASSRRGQRIGELLVRDCIDRARELGFRILQFNAVVATNERALRLYAKLGFTQLSTIPNGFRLDDGTYEDIIPHYLEL